MIYSIHILLLTVLSSFYACAFAFYSIRCMVHPVHPVHPVVARRNTNYYSRKHASRVWNTLPDDALNSESSRNFQKFVDMVTKFIDDDKKWKNEDEKWKKKANSKLKKAEKEMSKIGYLYEDLVSRDLVKSKGTDFARKFKLRNLSGLARLALPKNYYISHSSSASTGNITEDELDKVQVAKTDDWETSLLHQQRSRLLAHAASKHIPALQRWAHVKRNSRDVQGNELNKLILLENALERFAEFNSDTEAEAEEFLIHDRLGLYALSRETLVDAHSEGFTQEYEFDVRGESIFRDFLINVTAGESKSGAGRKQAILQLIKRLSILRCAIQHLLTEEQRQLFRMSLQGIIYTKDSQWVSPKKSEISAIADEYNIAIPMEGLSIVVMCI